MSFLKKINVLMSLILCSFIIFIFSADKKLFATPVNVAGDTSKILNTGSMWNGFEYGRPGEYSEYFDTFSQYVAGDWTITTTEGGTGDATEALSASISGNALVITNDNTTGDKDSLQRVGTIFTPTASKNIYCEFKLKTSELIFIIRNAYTLHL